MKKENKTFNSILKFLYKLTGFSILGLFLISIVLLLLFIFGNYHEFDDARQSLILQNLSFSVILFLFLCVIGFFESILMLIFVKVRFLYFLMIFIMIILLILFLTLLAFTGIVENLSEGLYLGIAYVK